MHIDALRELVEKELAEVREELQRLEERSAFLSEVIREIRRLAKTRGGTAPSRSPEPRRKRGGTTVAQAVLEVVRGATGPLSPREIIARAGSRTGSAAPGIRTQISNLTKEGKLVQVPHTGRGFLYRIAEPPADTSPPPEKTLPAPSPPPPPDEPPVAETPEA